MRTEIHVGWGSFSRLAWKHQDFLIKHYNKNARSCAFPVLMRGQTICLLCIYVSVTLIYSQTVAVFLGPVHGHSHLSICKHESNKLNNKLDHNFFICSPSCWTWPGGRCLKSRKEKSLCRKSPPSATVAPRVRVWILMLGTKPDIMWFTVRLLPFFFIAMSNFLTHAPPSVSLWRLWAATADDVWSGNWIVHVNSATTWRDSSPQSAQHSGGRVLVQILLRQRDPARQC